MTSTESMVLVTLSGFGQRDRHFLLARMTRSSTVLLQMIFPDLSTVLLAGLVRFLTF